MMHASKGVPQAEREPDFSGDEKVAHGQNNARDEGVQAGTDPTNCVDYGSIFAVACPSFRVEIGGPKSGQAEHRDDDTNSTHDANRLAAAEARLEVNPEWVAHRDQALYSHEDQHPAAVRRQDNPRELESATSRRAQMDLVEKELVEQNLNDEGKVVSHGQQRYIQDERPKVAHAGDCYHGG